MSVPLWFLDVLALLGAGLSLRLIYRGHREYYGFFFILISLVVYYLKASGDANDIEYVKEFGRPLAAILYIVIASYLFYRIRAGKHDR